MTTVTMLVGSLEPNTYNPNAMTAQAFAELVAEVRHLGRIPKPLVARPMKDGWHVIVDGEHSWRAAREAGLEQVPVEIVEIDDFEARRQTYKRNQHGAHNPVLLGRMFTQMMTERALSQRELAKVIEVSEGTVRNALAYAEATELRNCYAPGNDGENVQKIAQLAIRQVRTYLDLPEIIRDWWLRDGSNLKLLDSIMPSMPRQGGGRIKMELHYRDWAELNKDGLTEKATDFGFSYARDLWDIWVYADGKRRKLPNIFDYARPLVGLGLSHAVKLLEHTLPVRKSGDAWEIAISPEAWAEILADAAVRLNARTVEEFIQIVNAAIRLRLAAEGRDLDYTDPRVIETIEILKDAPDYIRDSTISHRDKFMLFTSTADVPLELLEEAKREAVKTLEARDAIVTGGMLDGAGISARDLEDLKAAWSPMTALSAFNNALVNVQRDAEIRTRNALLADREKLLSAALEKLLCLHKIRTTELNGKPTIDVMRDRLERLPWPEFLVLAACIVGYHDDAAEFWAQAIESETGAERQGKAAT